jgi:hypothetical protein
MGYFKRIWKHVWSAAVSVDQLGNVLWAFAQSLVGVSNEYGNPDETISSVLGRRAHLRKLRLPEKALVWVLDRIDDNHVADAIEPGVWCEHPHRALLSAPRRHSADS